MARSLVGSRVYVPAGTRVKRQGTTTTRQSGTMVTVRATELARGGKTRITWKSNGYNASALI